MTAALPCPFEPADWTRLIRSQEATGCPLARELRVLREMCSSRGDEAAVDEAEERYLGMWAAIENTKIAAPDYVPGKLDATAPARIWLQIDTGGSNEDRQADWPGTEGVSWYDEPIGGLEIEYVRADLVSGQKADAGEACESGDPSCGPVEFHDSEGVPLCRSCWDALEIDSARVEAAD